MLTGVDHIVLLTSDVEVSLAWYVDKFGVEPVRLDEWRDGNAPFVSVRVSEQFIIDLFPGEPEGTNVDHFALTCDREFFDEFVAANADIIVRGPMSLFGAQGQGDGVYMFDPDGHQVELRTY